MARRVLLCLCLLATAAAALPAVAGAKSKAKRPSLTLVSPMRVELGETLTIRGKNFNKEAKRNTVAFKAPNGRSILVKPTRATRKLLVVKVPDGLSKLFS